VAITKYLKKQLKRGKICFGSQLQRFQSMVIWACGKAKHHQGHNVAKLLTSWEPGRRERERERERCKGQDIPFKDTLPVTYFLQLGTTY
jgi:hypothetical protein